MYRFLMIIFFITLLNSANLNKMEFIYEYNNPTLGPIDGYHKAKVYLKDKKFIYLIDLQSGKKYKNYKNFPEVLDILNVLDKKDDNFDVQYNKNHQPIKIVSKKIGYTIDIYYKTDKGLNDSLIKEYERAYKKWKSANVKNYKFTYQIKGIKSFKEGIEVTVHNNKVVKAVDAYSRRRISTKNILTLDNLFRYANLAIKTKSVKRLYFDKHRGFVRYLEYQTPNHKRVKIATFNYIEIR